MEKRLFFKYCCRLIFPCLLLSVFAARAQNFDINILKSINQDRNKSLDRFTINLTNSVYPVSGIIPVAELMNGYIKHDSTMIFSGWQTVGGLGLNFIVTFGLKYAVNRPRPYATYPFIIPYQHDADPSFPSGHSSFSFNTATSLFMLYPRWYVGVIAYTWSASVAWSRMELGMHYPTDVLAGAIVGTGSAYLSAKCNKWLQRRHQMKKYSHGH